MTLSLVDEDSEVCSSGAERENAGWPRNPKFNWQNVKGMLSSAHHLLNAEWTDLALRQRYQRLRINLELNLRNTLWTHLIMDDKKAGVDPQSYHGHGVQFQAVCTARSKEVYTYQQFGVTDQREMRGMGFPCQLWRSCPSKWSLEKHPVEECCCEVDWARLIMEAKNQMHTGMSMTG